MAIVAGIDEAGLGPVLGPLVVSAAAFSVPDDLLDESLWSVLASAVCHRPTRRSGGKVAIADSKKLLNRKRAKPLEHLERAVLAMLAVRGARPGSLPELLSAVAPSAGDRMEQYPWYTGRQLPLPTCLSATNVALAANSLRVAMAEAGVRLAAMRCEPVFVGQFNEHVTATNNKATTLFDVTSRLLVWLWRNSPAGEVRIFVDRQGGRMRYLQPLQRVFDGCQFKIVDENQHRSEYVITGWGRSGRVCFLTSGESHHLPVALASMASKYLRELFMTAFNEFWAGHVPDLAPTAGYYTDGRRFYGEIADAVARLGIDERILYRCR